MMHACFCTLGIVSHINLGIFSIRCLGMFDKKLTSR